MEPKLTGRGILEPELLNAGGPRALKHATERLVAKSYGLMYDAVVSGFPPYETLLDEVFAYLERSAPVRADAPGPAVLDISCGVGTVAARLAARGYAVTGVDSVGHLVDVARRRHGRRPGSLRFENVDVAVVTVPGDGTFDVVLSMH
jgi:2-polyprenyl-3-methyl-5-hydroxy-6-metoxy-1,4-benzoquinol methylase